MKTEEPNFNLSDMKKVNKPGINLWCHAGGFNVILYKYIVSVPLGWC